MINLTHEYPDSQSTSVSSFASSPNSFLFQNNMNVQDLSLSNVWFPWFPRVCRSSSDRVDSTIPRFSYFWIPLHGNNRRSYLMCLSCCLEHRPGRISVTISTDPPSVGQTPLWLRRPFMSRNFKCNVKRDTTEL